MKLPTIVSSRGQSLIEVLAALSIAVVLASGVAIAVVVSLTNANLVTTQSAASEYAQQAMEIMRNLKDSDYTSYDTFTNNYCFAQDQAVPLNTSNNINGQPDNYGCSLNINNNFIREVDIEKNSCDCGTDLASANQILVDKVTVTVAWDDGRCPASGSVPAGVSNGSSCNSGLQNRINSNYCHSVVLTSCFTRLYDLARVYNSPIPTQAPTSTPVPTINQTPTLTPTPNTSPTPTPTIIVSGTLGYTVIGSSTDQADTNFMNATKFTMGASNLNIVSMWVAVGAVETAPNNQFQVAIYTNNANAPGTLVANSASATLTANAWSTVPISATLTANSTYWLAYNTNANASNRNNLKYDPGTIDQSGYRARTFGTWPASFGTPLYESFKFSIYASTAVGNTTPTPIPTPTPATIGYTTIGSSTDSGNFNTMDGTKFTVGGSPANITSMSVAVGAVGVAPNNQFQVAIYTDSSGNPGTLVANSSSATLTANAWSTVPISATLSANTTYWFVYNTNGSNSALNNLRYSSGTTGQSGYRSRTFGTWPASFGTATKEDFKFSIYASY